MLVEDRGLLKWLSYPAKSDVRPALRKVYIQCEDNLALWTHQQVPFVSYHIDLMLPNEERFAKYSAKLRQDIRRAQRSELQIQRNQDYHNLLTLLQLTIDARGLSAVHADHFRTKSTLLITSITHPEYATLAAHAYSLDLDGGRIRLEYNASGHRKFPLGSKARNLCGQANCLLFDDDFSFFKNAGYTIYDFGGYGVAPSVNYFKDQFHGQIVEQFNYFPIWYYWYRKLRQL
jgi:hypothetical protein